MLCCAVMLSRIAIRPYMYEKTMRRQSVLIPNVWPWLDLLPGVKKMKAKLAATEASVILPSAAGSKKKSPA